VIKSGQQVSIVKRDGSIVKSKLQQLQVFDGFGRKNAEEAAAGDIVALIGLEERRHQRQHLRHREPPARWSRKRSSRPTLTMMFSVNTSPFVGKEGKYVTSRNLRERLMKELESNVALKVEESERRARSRCPAAGCCTWES
jgi:GTP-binding protein